MCLIGVVITELGYENRVFYHLVNDAVLVVYTSRPIAGQTMFQGFGFTNPFERGALYIFDQRIDALDYSLIGILPIQVIIPSVAGERELHSAMARTVPLPDSSSAIDSSKRRAFAGDRSKYAVSSIAW